MPPHVCFTPATYAGKFAESIPLTQSQSTARTRHGEGMGSTFKAISVICVVWLTSVTTNFCPRGPGREQSPWRLRKDWGPTVPKVKEMVPYAAELYAPTSHSYILPSFKSGDHVVLC